MSSFEQLKAQAAELGLSGDEIGRYVLQQQALEREERALEREECKRRDELTEREEQRKHELAKLQAEKELELARIAVSSKPAPPNSHGECVDRPRLPAYKDGDDLVSYLTRFERIAELLKVDANDYAVRLGALLSGKAARIYTSFSPEVISDYTLLKKSLLRSFCKTTDGFRVDFRSSKIQPGETYQQFSIQLGRYFEQWLEASNIDSTFSSLKDFMVLDQFLASLLPDLRTFIKERGVYTLGEAVQLADNWTSARNLYPKSSHSSQASRKSNKKEPAFTDAGSPAAKGSVSTLKCHQCGEVGHIRPRCPKNPRAFKQETSSTVKVGFCCDDRKVSNYCVSGTINGTWTSTIIRDTGCSSLIVSEEALPDADTTNCRKVTVYDYLGRSDTFPIVRCYLRCPYYDGWADAIRAPIKFATAMIGDIPGARKPDDPAPPVVSNVSASVSNVPASISVSQEQESLPVNNTAPATVVTSAQDIVSSSESELVCVVQTRAASARMKRLHPLVLPDLQPLKVTPSEFARLQETCPSLGSVRSKASTEQPEVARNGATYKFLWSDGLLYRECVASDRPGKVGTRTLVLPSDCRQVVLQVAHESPLAGHFSHRKTEWKVSTHFFWPGMGADIRDYCRSCDICQRKSYKGRVKNVPLQPLPVITEPFSRVAVDIVGPLSPPSSEGHKYILTLIDFASGFPEAIPLKDVDSVSVAEALLSIFSRVGIPREILSDRGTQFTSHLMAELHKLLGVKPQFTTPFHPSGNGRVERLHGPLKAILRKLCSEKPREWHRYLIPTLFALREMPSDRTGFSAFDLLYGRTVRGPLTVLKDLWEDRQLNDQDRTSLQYVIELRDKLTECAQIAAREADVSVSKYKSYFDLRSQDRQFKPGDEVLVLLPDSHKKLLVSWHGPFKVLEKRNKVDYLVDDPSGPKLYHANLLKQYYRRAHVNFAHVMDEVSVVDNDHTPAGPFEAEDPDDTVPCTSFSIPDSVLDSVPNVNESLEWDRRASLEDLLSNFKDVFSQTPGCTTILQHDIVLSSTRRICAKNYPVPIHLRPYFETEVDNLLQLGIIQPSSSPHCSPVVMVRKSDGSYRMAIDFRQLNSITVFDAEPTCSAEVDLYKFVGATYFSELDLCKAYYQIPLTDRAKPLTAFSTHRGLMEFCRLPFGLVTACSTYIRLMRIVLADLPNICFYFDNIFIYSSDWPSHLSALTSVLERLRHHGLTAKPSKCRFGFPSVQYLGFVIDGVHLRPMQDKTEALKQISPPTTKKSLRSFLGMVSFYRRFIPLASELTGPLSDLLRKPQREPLRWTEDLLSRFTKLKDALSSLPVLRLPNPALPFVLRTDASNFGLGAVLLQYHDGTPHPVAYASRKMLDRERKYSTIEKEALAILFGITKFDFYLRGKQFILETDHKPLVYLQKSTSSNDRLTRWALQLQNYPFRLVHIAGTDNIGADFLSRSW